MNGSTNGPILGSSSLRSTSIQTSNGNRPVYQICGRIGHIFLDCYHRFDFSYQGCHPPIKLTAMIAESNAQFEHQVWYANNGVNAYITSNHQNLTHLLPFNGGETVTGGNGTCLLIKSTSSTSLQIGYLIFSCPIF